MLAAKQQEVCLTSSSSSPMQTTDTQANQVIVLLDVDNTVVNGASELNHPLLETLKHYGLNRIVLFTSYDLTYRLLPSAKLNCTRWDIIRRLKALGIAVEAVLVSASPFQETPESFGHYYQTVIMPIEALARKALLQNPTASLDNLLKAANVQDSLAQEELQLIQSRMGQAFGGMPLWSEDEYKNGKQHLLTHAVQHYQKQGIKHFLVIDDKPEVLQVAKRAADEKIYGDNINLYVVPVKFNQVHSEEASVYHQNLQAWPIFSNANALLAKADKEEQLPSLLLHDGQKIVHYAHPQNLAWLERYAQLHLSVPDEPAKAVCEAHMNQHFAALASKWSIHTVDVNDSPPSLQLVQARAEICQKIHVDAPSSQLDEAFLELPEETILNALLEEDVKNPSLYSYIEACRVLFHYRQVLTGLAAEAASNTAVKLRTSWHLGLFRSSKLDAKAGEIVNRIISALSLPYALENKLLLLYSVVHLNLDAKWQKALLKRLKEAEAAVAGVATGKQKDSAIDNTIEQVLIERLRVLGHPMTKLELEAACKPYASKLAEASIDALNEILSNPLTHKQVNSKAMAAQV